MSRSLLVGWLALPWFVTAVLAMMPPEKIKPMRTFPSLPRPVSSFGAAVCDGWLYVYGGHVGKPHEYSTEAVVGTFHRLNLARPADWEPLPGGPALQGLALVAHGGKLYRIGGMQPRNAPGEPADNHSLRSFACFDPAQGRWQDLPDLPAGRSSHDATIVGDLLVVIGGWRMGGVDAEPQWHDTALICDLKQTPGKWEAVPQPFQRRALTTATFQNRVYVLAGLGAEGTERTVNVFDPVQRTWTLGPELPGPRMNGFAPAACVAGDRLYANPSNGKVYVLAADGSAWQEVGRIPTPRLVHRLVPLGDDLLLCLGGSTKAGGVGQVETVEWSSQPVRAADGGK